MCVCACVCWGGGCRSAGEGSFVVLLLKKKQNLVISFWCGLHSSKSCLELNFLWGRGYN